MKKNCPRSAYLIHVILVKSAVWMYCDGDAGAVKKKKFFLFKLKERIFVVPWRLMIFFQSTIVMELSKNGRVRMQQVVCDARDEIFPA